MNLNKCTLTDYGTRDMALLMPHCCAHSTRASEMGKERKIMGGFLRDKQKYFKLSWDM